MGVTNRKPFGVAVLLAGALAICLGSATKVEGEDPTPGGTGGNANLPTIVAGISFSKQANNGNPIYKIKGTATINNCTGHTSYAAYVKIFRNDGTVNNPNWVPVDNMTESGQIGVGIDTVTATLEIVIPTPPAPNGVTYKCVVSGSVYVGFNETKLKEDSKEQKAVP